MKRMFAVSAAALALMTAAAPVMAQTPNNASDSPKAERMAKRHTGTLLTLSETAEVRSTPDVAFITFGVVTEAKTAEEAMKLNAQKMNSVFAAVKAQGIADKNVQTTGLNLNAVYDYPQNGGTPVLRGYQANNRISVRVEDTKKLGGAIDAVVKAGINQIDGIAFGLKDPTAAEDKARLEATKTLMARAELYAKSLGKTVKRIKSLNENASLSAPPPMPMYRMKAEMAADSTPVAGGEVSTSLTLNAEFELE
ncbi:SIMPL domain-containing protein [Asticcacaulis sp. AND118]|uniref:SIMPL domain-containing protein n=1 Tax=Asticcacaulis sp. AND118 TaxID=2840468 RepID=UPI001CFF94CB|nr:SIMPL domain-containing protein [Asticcacaulis sp. AND118]UDF04976.1 SIMPL domain-containing protein [Asticcacaulis sp. AND118]